MDIVTIEMEIPAEEQRNLFGMQDHYIKSIESEYQVDIINRGGTVKIKGEESIGEKDECLGWSMARVGI